MGPAAVFARLLRFRLRRDRTQLLVWGVAFLLLTVLVVGEVRSTFGSTAERAAMLKVLLVTPAVLMFRGTPQGASEGDVVAVLGITFIALLTGLMSTFLVVRHTRAEEERGPAEAIASTAAGRLLPTLAVVADGVLANLVATVAIAVGCLAEGLPAAGSWLFGAACGVAGLSFLGVALLLAQLFPSSRTANGWAAALVVVAYFLRGAGDAAGTPHPSTLSLTPAWPSWLSPIGWAQATLPWAQDRVWPLALGAACFIVLTAAALVIQERRDVGAGLFAERRARTTASPLLAGPLGLALRLQRGGLLGWLVGVVALAALLGALSGSVVQQLEQAGPGVADAITQIGGASGTVLQAFANLGAVFAALLASAIGVQGAIRLRQEEAAGSADAVLAGAVGRARWMLASLLVAATGIVVSLVAGGAVAALAARAAGGLTAQGVDAGSAPRSSATTMGSWFWSFVWQVPSALVLLGLVALVFAVLPGATSGVGWAVFAAAAFLGLFGPVVGLPSWARHLAPSADAPAVALPHPDYTGGWVMAALAVAFAAAGVAFFLRRDTRPVA